METKRGVFGIVPKVIHYFIDQIGFPGYKRADNNVYVCFCVIYLLHYLFGMNEKKERNAFTVFHIIYGFGVSLHSLNVIVVARTTFIFIILVWIVSKNHSGIKNENI